MGERLQSLLAPLAPFALIAALVLALPLLQPGVRAAAGENTIESVSVVTPDRVRITFRAPLTPEQSAAGNFRLAEAAAPGCPVPPSLPSPATPCSAPPGPAVRRRPSP